VENAVTTEHLLYVSATGDGRGANTLLACFIERRELFSASAASLCGSSTDGNRRRRITLVHLEFLCRGSRDHLANCSAQASGSPRALSLCSQSHVRRSCDHSNRRSDLLSFGSSSNRGGNLFHPG